MTDAPELLPCPFCGGEAETTLGPVPGKWGARCKVCDVWRDDREPNKAEAIAAWNARAPDPRVAALMETLQDVAEECLSDEIPEGYGPDLTENPEFHRGYDAALHRVRRAIAKFKEASRE